MDFIATILYLLLTLFLKYGPPIQHTISKRIKGGDEVQDNQFSYMVSLQNSIIHVHFCAGVIISRQWVLSAGHCLKRRPKEKVVVKAGSMFLDQGTSYKVNEIIIHPNFEQTIQHIANDVALLHLETPFQFNQNITAVDLGRIGDESGIWVLTAGWGTSSFRLGTPLSNHLRQLIFQTMDSENCRKLHSKVGNVVDTEICAFGGLGKSPCSGDSGGPLIALDTMRLVGIFSGFETCKGDFPALFVRLSGYVDWLRSVTGLELQLD